MALPGHDNTCTLIYSPKGRTSYTCLNCQQALSARIDERNAIIKIVAGFYTKPDPLANDWEIGYRKAIQRVLERLSGETID